MRNIFIGAALALIGIYVLQSFNITWRDAAHTASEILAEVQQ